MRAVALVLGLVLVASAAQAQLDTQKVIEELQLREGVKAVRDMPGWSKPKKVAVLIDGPERLKWLQQVAPGVELIPVPRPPEAGKVVTADVEALVGICNTPAVNAAPKVKWVHVGSAGVNECLEVPRLASGEVLVTNMQRVYGPPMAEHVIALTFALARNFLVFDNLQRQSTWNQTALPFDKFMELQGKTMLIAGLGGIGTEIAKRANALGMNVIATRNSGRDGPAYVSYVGLSKELPELIGRADVVVNATPLTPETENLFNAAMFAKMKPTAFFINVGRGQQVNQPDLIAALEKKVIAGAAIDVADPEPLPKDHPLWKAPNLIITPHTSSFSDLRMERFWVVLRENLRRYVAGDKLYSVVDVKRGY
jgi:phosphoglycerate dehydrogenase-like enzyme